MCTGRTHTTHTHPRKGVGGSRPCLVKNNDSRDELARGPDRCCRIPATRIEAEGYVTQPPCYKLVYRDADPLWIQTDFELQTIHNENARLCVERDGANKARSEAIYNLQVEAARSTNAEESLVKKSEVHMFDY